MDKELLAVLIMLGMVIAIGVFVGLVCFGVIEW